MVTSKDGDLFKDGASSPFSTIQNYGPYYLMTAHLLFPRNKISPSGGCAENPTERHAIPVMTRLSLFTQYTSTLKNLRKGMQTWDQNILERVMSHFLS